MDSAPILIKVGGHNLSDTVFLAEFANVIRRINRPALIVHGGGKEISGLQQKLGIEPRYLDGVRVTDGPSLSVVEMVLCGTVNTRLVRYLILAGVDALGLSGVDRGLIRAKRMGHATVDMGYTGEVTSVRADLLQGLIKQGILPVIAPICLGDDSAYNVNADHVAGAVAAAVNVGQVVFLTNVSGVLVSDRPVPRLTASEAVQLINEGVITGGMIPKVKTALRILKNGIPEAVITDLAGLNTGAGTVFVP